MTAALSFGGWLKRRRMSLGLTQKELARQVGYAQVTVRKVEADELRPSGQMARKLAEALDLASDEQAQFVRFARDEAHWDALRLPDRSPSTPLPVTQLPVIPFDRRPLKHNLPALTTALIGRDEELAELAQLLADSATRLITILSAGGMGKTSLAIAASAQQVEQFPDGVCWVPLAPLTDAKDLVCSQARGSAQLSTRFMSIMRTSTLRNGMGARFHRSRRLVPKRPDRRRDLHPRGVRDLH